jgi:kynureninase
MFQDQVNFHGYKADDALRIKRREEQHRCGKSKAGDELALVLIGGELLQVRF